MNKTKLKTFATWARNELMKSVQIRLELLGIKSSDDITKPQELMNEIEIGNIRCKKSTYDALIKQLNYLGYEELIEETAYTWFNRLVALGYMDINGYDDDKMLISTSSKISPDIMDYYMDAKFFDELKPDEKEEIHKLKDKRDDENLYAQLVDWKCNSLNEIMPFMFQKRGDYTELLFPMGILSKEGFIEKLRDVLADSVEELEENGELKKIAPVEMIGWLYQFYNSEKKDEVFAGLKKNKKITKENIPAATQLFTPKWIVKYMAENSLGKLALESLGVSESIKDNWKYYIEPIDNGELKIDNEKIKIEDIKILDPAMGSGHMLTYSFDMLFDIYQDLGWTDKEAVLSILSNNIYGLEIDDRAAQLASFALIMKAREKFRRVFRVLGREKVVLNTLAVKESNSLSEYAEQQIVVNQLKELEYIIRTFENAKELGSIIEMREIDYAKVDEELEKFKNIMGFAFDNEKDVIEAMIKQSKSMTSKYDVVITNPPYMGGKGYSPILKKYVEKHYKDSKSDLFAVFMEKCGNYTAMNRYNAMIVMPSWLFLSSFEKLRNSLIETKTISSLLHMGRGIFGIDWGSVAFVLKNEINENYVGSYYRLHKRNFQHIYFEDIAKIFKYSKNNMNYKYDFDLYRDESGTNEIPESGIESGQQIKYTANQKDFEKIPGSPIAYWVSDRVKEIFATSEKLGEVGDAKVGLQTADNNRFLRLWSEVNKSSYKLNCKSNGEALECGKKWFPYNKGGEKRRWYGNQEYLVNWENDGYEIKNFENSVIRNPTFYFRESISWGLITSGGCSFRYFPNGFIYDVAGMSYFTEKEMLHTLGILNNKLYYDLTKVLNPTINLQIGDVANLPYANFENIKFDEIVQQNIDIAKEEWDSRETSWDFRKSQVVGSREQVVKIEEAFKGYSHYWTEKFVQMHKNEEELNRLFIEIYGLEDEMTPDVEPTDITLLKNEVKVIKMEPQMDTDEHRLELEKISANSWQKIKGFKLEFQYDELAKQLISYAVGCIMGRYSLDKEGLIIANSDDKLIIDNGKLTIKGDSGEIRHEIENPSFIPDADGIVPIVNNMDSFDDDIVARIAEFVKVVYGEDKLEDNLKFLAENLGGKKSESARDTLRRYMTKEFYKDHLKRYKKRPIYWYMKSGKKDAFGALIYLHRYNETTIAKVRTDYLLKYQEILDNTSAFAKRELDNDELDPKERKSIEKRLKLISDEMEELRDYANEVKHYADQRIAIDLDDGVKVNYEKFGKILAKI